MEIQKSKVYVLLDERSRIIRCEGGYTMSNIDDMSQWTYIDEGTGDRYNLCQSHYFGKPVMTAYGAYNYKLVDGKPVECTAEEIADQEESLKPVPTPSLENRVEVLESTTDDMILLMADLIGGE